MRGADYFGGDKARRRSECVIDDGQQRVCPNGRNPETAWVFLGQALIRLGHPKRGIAHAMAARFDVTGQHANEQRVGIDRHA